MAVIGMHRVLPNVKHKGIMSGVGEMKKGSVEWKHRKLKIKIKVIVSGSRRGHENQTIRKGQTTQTLEHINK